MPFLSSTGTRSRSAGSLEQTLNTGADGAEAAYDRSATAGEVHTRMARLNAVWLRPTDSGGRLQMRLGTMQARNERVTRRHEFGDADDLIRDRHEDGGARDRSVDFNGKFSQLVAERTAFPAPAGSCSAPAARTACASLVNGAALLTEFGENLERPGAARGRLTHRTNGSGARPSRSTWACAGRASTPAATPQNRAPCANRSSVLTPLAHMVWKLPDAPRDQLRLSPDAQLPRTQHSQADRAADLSTL
jgi:hypothetical protein